jgi:peptide/nickel transport system substrate-binding protein
VEIRILEWSSFIHQYIDKRNFEAVVLGWSLSRDPDCYNIWHSSQINEGQYNFVSYSNPEVDKLIVQGTEVFDIEKRKLIYNKIHAIIADDQPYTFLYVPDALPAVANRIHGIEVGPIGIGYNFIKWYIPEGQQKYTSR